MRTTIQPSLLSTDHNGVSSAIAAVSAAAAAASPIDQQHVSASVQFSSTSDLNSSNNNTTRSLPPSHTVNAVLVKQGKNKSKSSAPSSSSKQQTHNVNAVPGPSSSSSSSASPHPAAPHISSPSQLPASQQLGVGDTSTLQAILAGVKTGGTSSASVLDPVHAWDATSCPVSPEMNESIPRISQTAIGKRKADDSSFEDSDDPRRKIRKTVSEVLSQDASRISPMTTVVCLHAAVAQKSYGSEKRFLCPPPVVHVEGPVWHLRGQHMSMAVVAETGDRSYEQRAELDANMSSSFKSLHVNSSTKAKSFQLSLDIIDPRPSSAGSEGSSDGQVTGRTWASFDSAPVSIISKPSKKTAKTRNISSCILAGGPVSLFNRINSQTVRTKYMTIENQSLFASNVNWSAFNVNVVRRPQDVIVTEGPQPVTYGSEIMLSDTQTGISTTSLIIRKVDKGRVSLEEGAPVSQMQKIALQRVNADGSRHYLSAAGPISGPPGIMTPPAPGSSQQASSHALLFQTPRIHDEVKDGMRVFFDEVDDYLCWTIVGISKFQYTFFDAFGHKDSIPDAPITPFPTLFTGPCYRPTEHTIELTVSNFFYVDPKTKSRRALDVYLGTLGPLQQRIYAQPADGAASLQNMVEMPATGQGVMMAPNNAQAMGYGVHSIVFVQLPPLEDILRALQDDVGRDSSGGSGGSGDRESSTTGSIDSTTGATTAIPASSISGRSLPLLFIRPTDGVGYHSGRTVVCENVFQNLDLSSIASAGTGDDASWIAAAQAAAVAAAAAAEGGLHGWSLRVI